MNKKIKYSLLIFGMFACVAFLHGKASAYNAKHTHPYLARQTIEFYNHFNDTKINKEEEEWIVWGAEHEDKLPRFVNHFYDPIHNTGWSMFLSAKEWSNDLMQNYSDYGGNYTWDNALEYYASGNREMAFKALGHILHLIEDMTVPEHTRDDPHYPTNESPYEDKYSGSMPGMTVNALLNRSIEPVYYDDLDKYFDELATYSNKYFFSEDTVLDTLEKGKYEFPKLVSSDTEKIGNKEIKFGYGKDENGEYMRLVQILEPSSWRKWTVGYHLEAYKEVYTVDNDLVLSDYWVHLAPKAISHGAGVIRLFFKEAGVQGGAPQKNNTVGECQMDDECGDNQVCDNLKCACKEGYVLVDDECVLKEGVTGKIEGSLGYPSEYVPDDMEVCAIDISSDKIFCVDNKEEITKYSLEVPAGEYAVAIFREYVDPMGPAFYIGLYTEQEKCTQECDNKYPDPMKDNNWTNCRKDCFSDPPDMLLLTVGEGETFTDINPNSYLAEQECESKCDTKKDCYIDCIRNNLASKAISKENLDMDIISKETINSDKNVEENTVSKSSKECEGAQLCQTYGNTSRDVFFSVQETFDRGYVMAGSKRGTGNYLDSLWVLKTDNNGDVMWDKNYDSYTVSHEADEIIQQTIDGGYVVVGQVFECHGDEDEINSMEPCSDIALIKLDSKGEIEWTREYGRKGEDDPTHIKQEYDGGYIIFSSRNNWLIRTDSEGNTCDLEDDINCYESENKWSIIVKASGGIGAFSSFRQFQGASVSGYALAGSKTDSMEARSWNNDFWYVVIEASGEVIFDQTYPLDTWDVALDSDQTLDGGFVLTGWSNNGENGKDFLILKIDSSGQKEWHKYIGSTENELAYGIEQTKEGNYYIIGEAGEINKEGVYVVKTDIDGNLLSSKKFVDAYKYNVNSIQLTSDNGVIIAGYEQDQDYNTDAVLIKIID